MTARRCSNPGHPWCRCEWCAYLRATPSHCVPGGEAEDAGQRGQRFTHEGFDVRTYVTVPGREGLAGELWPLWGFEVSKGGKVLHRSGFELEDVDGYYIEADAADNARSWIEHNRRTA